MMFCQNCGTKGIDGARFCQKCGAEIAFTETAGQITYDSAPILGMINAPDNQNNDFKKFIDNHVKKVTGLQSAEELLKSSVPLKYVKTCYGIFGILWMIMLFQSASSDGFEGLILAFLCIIFFFLFGALAAIIVGGIKKTQYSAKTKPFGKIDGHINPEELLRFLNSHLRCLSPYFDEWDYYKENKYARPGIAGMMVTAMENTQLRLGAEFGKEHKYQCFSVIHIRNDISEPGKTQYICEAKDRIGNVFGAEYSCLVRTAPILQAAMEYYIMEKNN